MKTQSINKTGPGYHFTTFNIVLVLFMLIAAFGIILSAVTESVAVSAVSIEVAPVAIRQETLKDAWLERGTALSLAEYSVERQEVLKDAFLNRNVVIENLSATDIWLAGGGPR